MEPLHNIESICTRCADERLKEFQRLNPRLVLKPGDYVKLGFTQQVDGKIETEHMWVKVTLLGNTKSGIYVGKLDNNPILVNNVKYGDIINFTIKQVAQLITN